MRVGGEQGGCCGRGKSDNTETASTTPPGEVATIETVEGHVYVGELKDGMR